MRTDPIKTGLHLPDQIERCKMGTEQDRAPLTKPLRSWRRQNNGNNDLRPSLQWPPRTPLRGFGNLPLVGAGFHLFHLFKGERLRQVAKLETLLMEWLVIVAVEVNRPIGFPVGDAVIWHCL